MEEQWNNREHPNLVTPITPSPLPSPQAMELAGLLELFSRLLTAGELSYVLALYELVCNFPDELLAC